MAILLIYLMTEATALAGLFLVQRRYGIEYAPMQSALNDEQRTALKQFVETGQGMHVTQDPDLGWTSREEVNSAGMRDDREYGRVPAPGVVRVSAFGDSFTYGADVKISETWIKQLASLEPSMEVLNYGMAAYGLDQGYLRYLRVGLEYSPNIVLIGYMSENFARDVNVFRPFYSQSYSHTIFTKPRFKLVDDTLVLIRNPLATVADYKRFLQRDRDVLSELGENDYYYQVGYTRGTFDFLPTVRLAKLLRTAIEKRRLDPIVDDGRYNARSEAYVVTLKIFDAFYKTVLENGALPIVVILPDLYDFGRSRNGQETRYGVLLDYFHQKGYRYVDIMDAFKPYAKTYTVEELTKAWGHYSPLGNQIVASYLSTQLKAWRFDDVSKVNEAVQLELTRKGLTSRSGG